MKRSGFLKSLAVGVAAVTMAPALLAKESPKIIRFSNASNCTITLPHGLTRGFKVKVKGATLLRGCTITTSAGSAMPTLVFDDEVDIQRWFFTNVDVRFEGQARGVFSHNHIYRENQITATGHLLYRDGQGKIRISPSSSDK